jgi:hypothetical protein
MTFGALGTGFALYVRVSPRWWSFDPLQAPLIPPAMGKGLSRGSHWMNTRNATKVMVATAAATAALNLYGGRDASPMATLEAARQLLDNPPSLHASPSQQSSGVTMLTSSSPLLSTRRPAERGG